jgi:AraC-like DNA-binding protein
MNDYLIKASALQGVRVTLESLDGDANALFQRASLAGMEDLTESWISYRRFLLMLEDAARVTRCPYFGLHLSQRQGIEILGAVGFVIQQAPDLRTALRELAMYYRHHNQGAVISLEVQGGLARWRFNCKLEGKVSIWQQEDLVGGIAINLLRLLWRPGWSPEAIYLTHATPDDIRPYRERFECPVFFNWECCELVFDAELLDIPLTEANPELHRVLEKHLGSLQQSLPDDYSGQVSALINQAMLTGDCSIDRVAQFMGINKRTLQRQLKSRDCSYKELLDEVRFDVAKRYLSESSCSLTALSDMLCYSELSAFSTAFRRYFGVSPRAWKKQQQSLPAR